MFRDRLTPLLLVLAIAGCKENDTTVPDAVDGGTPTADGGDGTPIKSSAKSNLRFKRQQRLANDMAQALGLEPSAVCDELGVADCFEVHRIPMGGVAPYIEGIFVPLDNTTVTTPLAVERIALAGCEKRVDADLTGSDPQIFKDVLVGPLGNLADPQGEAVRNAIDTLYKRAVLRPASEAEIAHLVAFHQEVVDTGDERSARSWMILSCYAVLTSMEALFY